MCACMCVCRFDELILASLTYFASSLFTFQQLSCGGEREASSRDIKKLISLLGLIKIHHIKQTPVHSKVYIRK